MNKLNELKREKSVMEEVLNLQFARIVDLEETIESYKARVEKLESIITRFTSWTEDALKSLDSLNASKDLIDDGAKLWLEASKTVVKYTDDEVVSPMV